MGANGLGAVRGNERSPKPRYSLSIMYRIAGEMKSVALLRITFPCNFAACVFIVWVVGPSVIFTFLNPNGLEQTKLFFAFLFPTLAGYVHEGGEH